VTGAMDARALTLEFPCKSASGKLLEPIRQVINFCRLGQLTGERLRGRTTEQVMCLN
jgi:hypothetical protein